MASGAEHYAAAEQALALAASTGSAMAARIGDGHASLALAAANIAVAMQNKPVGTTATDDMKAWSTAVKSTGALPKITVDAEGAVVVAS